MLRPREVSIITQDPTARSRDRHPNQRDLVPNSLTKLLFFSLSQEFPRKSPWKAFFLKAITSETQVLRDKESIPTPQAVVSRAAEAHEDTFRLALGQPCPFLVLIGPLSSQILHSNPTPGCKINTSLPTPAPNEPLVQP